METGDIDFFFWSEMVMKFGKAIAFDGRFLYRFVNDEIRMFEERNLLKRVKEGTRDIRDYEKARRN